MALAGAGAPLVSGHGRPDSFDVLAATGPSGLGAFLTANWTAHVVVPFGPIGPEGDYTPLGIENNGGISEADVMLLTGP